MAARQCVTQQRAIVQQVPMATRTADRRLDLPVLVPVLVL